MSKTGKYAKKIPVSANVRMAHIAALDIIAREERDAGEVCSRSSLIADAIKQFLEVDHRTRAVPLTTLAVTKRCDEIIAQKTG